MPWQECNPMDERLKFVAGLLDGDKRLMGLMQKVDGDPMIEINPALWPGLELN
jgi:hypothetical protein